MTNDLWFEFNKKD